MSGAVPFKTAWQDPEHVRLSMFRSPGDDSPKAERGPLPDAENPWLDAAGSAHEPAGRRTAAHLPPRSDEYAGFRCSCRHLVYETDLDGGFCGICDCSEHTAPAARARQEVA